MAADSIVGILLNAGVAGGMLLWFMSRAENRLERAERALDRLTRAQMLTLIARPDVEEPIKQHARLILSEMSPGFGDQVPPK